METHVKVLGILNIGFGILGVIGFLLMAILFFIFGAGMFTWLIGANGQGDEKALAGVVGVISIVVVVIAVIGVLWSSISIIIGLGLMKYKNWARILAIVFAILSLASSIPTAFTGGGIVISITSVGLSVYTLWVLFSAEGARLFQKRLF